MTIPSFLNPDDSISNTGTVGEFWRWAMSDLLGNRNRGIFAEYLVGKALGDDALSQPRMEWDCYDLDYRGVRIEVKSSAYIQTWHTDPTKRSKPSFSVPPHECWDARSALNDPTRKRHAHLYVFCIFPLDPAETRRDVLAVEAWGFYVTTTANLEQHITPQTASLGIAAVRKICGQSVTYTNLKTAIDSLIT
jgi:hypothetical protein